jgi:hypothetical protein
MRPLATVTTTSSFAAVISIMLVLAAAARGEGQQAQNRAFASSSLVDCQGCLAAGFGWSKKKGKCGQFTMRDPSQCPPAAAPSGSVQQQPTAVPKQPTVVPKHDHVGEAGLSEAQLLEFLERGFLELSIPPSELPRKAHFDAYARTTRLWEAGGRKLGAQLGNNVRNTAAATRRIAPTHTVHTRARARAHTHTHT